MNTVEDIKSAACNLLDVAVYTGYNGGFADGLDKMHKCISWFVTSTTSERIDVFGFHDIHELIKMTPQDMLQKFEAVM